MSEPIESSAILNPLIRSRVRVPSAEPLLSFIACCSIAKVMRWAPLVNNVDHPFWPV
jgi:hypothetical protein